MDPRFLDKLSDPLKFAVCATFIAFLFGMIGYTYLIAAEHMLFFISAPLATYIPSYFLWKLTFKKKDDYKFGNVIAISIFLTLITHYLNFIILGFGNSIQFMFNPEYLHPLDLSKSILLALIFAPIFQTLISLALWGILTLFFFILTGTYVLRTSTLSKPSNDR